MATNTSIELTSLDFSEIKNSLIAFLRTQDRFKDINYQGSNINTLLDVLAYNTYHQSFYLNMLASEMFLDSAQLRSSVVSHAKELNYVPRSFRSATATLDIKLTVDPETTEVFIPKNTVFSSSVGGNTFTFTTAQNIVTQPVTGTPGVFVANNVSIYEGVYLYDTFVVNDSVDNQKFIISSPTIDTTSLTVKVVEDSGQTVLDYLVRTSLFGLEPNSQVCFLQATGSGEYEIVFGSSAFVRKPKDGAVIIAEYRACSGELPNGASEFTTDISDTDVEITIVSVASGGAVTETNDEIKFSAPRFFQTQERAVTTSDYSTLLKLQFPEIRAVSAYGGEEVTPPQYGKVVISVDLDNAEGITDSKKYQYSEWIKPRMPLAIDPVFIDPDFTYIKVQTIVKFNQNATDLTSVDIQSLVQETILTYFENNVNDFNTTLRYSKLVQEIDSCDTSILSNETTLTVYKLFQPETGVAESYRIDFSNPLTKIKSSEFVRNGVLCYLQDDGEGQVSIKNSSTDEIIVTSTGELDYNTGILTISKLVVDSVTSSAGLIFTATTKEVDVVGKRNNIITVRGSDVTVTVKSERL